MSSNETKIRIKLGGIEVDYQGDHAFLKDDLLAMLRQLIELQKQHPVLNKPSGANEKDSDSDRSGADTDLGELSTDTIATVLKAETGSDLIMAAAAQLRLVKKKQTFTRQELIDVACTRFG